MPSANAMKIMADKPTRGGAWGSQQRKDYLASRRQPTYAETYNQSGFQQGPPDWEKIKSWGNAVPIAKYARNTLGLKGREFGQLMRAYNQQYRREPLQQFVNPELLQQYGLYNPYASGNPGGLQRGGGMF